MNPSQPEAEAIAIKDDKIAEVGTNEKVSSWINKNTRVINIDGKTAVPGFIDTHIHVADFGKFLTWIDLRTVKSIREMQTVLRERVQKTPKGKWVIGRGWDQNRFAEKRLPTRYDLDAAAPENPVILYHQCGQVCVVNSKALELAGVTKQASAPQGGAIDKNERIGELTGVLRDDATNLVWKIVPELGEEELVEAAGLACEKIVEAGVTSIHWMVLSSIEISIIKRLHKENKLPLRVYVVVPMNLLDNVASLGPQTELKDNIVRIGGVEIFADGYLAARTAALLQPYSDDPAESGTLLSTQEEMNASAAKILKAGFQPVIHAMGDKAVDAA